ncbi:hypothetical protein J3Q64DRAFT_1673663 [Phycomyces blakesleeanus]|uniref:GDP/GTP exchange factor Sec2 N-terminal domain-containing protein n=2 Tax=Phycomyces blakesleeanus TaxID=4837 RepID=A0A162V7C3_PHYB8|nr:hypothetical protein PHYBLDRAFT_138094 [Phycomyces blakesleeanus NRRL 1555(-)]OAD80532.1 hypothetical protein PHYBLDRAFT_138094 [Phycomyces blakesleeanus NRRL 1555(-)]|eukprot:XP_018298572.1 hypothetical protein PHYBLDRAFT_138094 [Phycomyces blakesleeanus NRRL 1555(-)]
MSTELASVTDQILSIRRTLELQAAEIAKLKGDLILKDEAFERQRLDLETLNTKYVSEIEHVADIQHEKDLAERELEELSSQLFEEANGMVATEKRAKWILETQLKQTQANLEAERSQLNALQHILQDTLAKAPQNQPLSIQCNSLVYQQPQEKPWHTMSEAFRIFVSQPSTSMKKLRQSAYVRQCQVEDVEPCLRLGPPSKISAKKLMESLAGQACCIEPTPDTEDVGSCNDSLSVRPHRFLWDRFSSPTDPHSCAVCGRPTGYPTPYRFKLDASDEWSLVDSSCRDRLVAVCEFYSFVRRVQQTATSNRSIHALYAESIRLRLQMGYARLGVLPWMLEELNALYKKMKPSGSLPDDSDEGSVSSGPHTPIHSRISSSSSHSECHVQSTWSGSKPSSESSTQDCEERTI